MKTIQILRTLINLLFYTLIAIFALGFAFGVILLFFPEILPSPYNAYTMLFSSFFTWKMYLMPSIAIINYVLLILAIFFLKKSVSSFLKSDFYSERVTKNLQKGGSLFIFIGVSTITIQFFSAIYIQNIANDMIGGQYNFLIRWSNILAAAIDLKSIIAIIIGLFFLLFSKIFENSRVLKQENDLTI
ncbi:hypothetical protein GCM10011416_08940 [Polaribacter pacificus]|uniref:DUF2975 domain-containing protein n=1 Tax=Polaribacter pacificus TaxID=1775173 RepID=A0A917MCT9_9FLAO|nr:DUF2975 domain-containing protein [Polaribacter pacificus]GGG93903.1 hypothetical protein GCM10011416_08940 [Polaribacter pacificus]